MTTESLLISIAAQIPVVVIFVWFILRWTDKIEKAAERRLEMQIKAQAEQENLWRDEATKRDELWRDFLKDEREHRSSSTARLAEEIKGIAQIASLTHSIMERHDERADTYIDGRMSENK